MCASVFRRFFFLLFISDLDIDSNAILYSYRVKRIVHRKIHGQLTFNKNKTKKKIKNQRTTTIIIIKSKLFYHQRYLDIAKSTKL